MEPRRGEEGATLMLLLRQHNQNCMNLIYLIYFGFLWESSLPPVLCRHSFESAASVGSIIALGEYLDSRDFWTDFRFLNSLFIVLLTTKSSLFCQINRCKSTIVPVYQTVCSRATERRHDGVSVGGLVAISKESKMIVEFFFAVGFEGTVATILFLSHLSWPFDLE